MENPARNERYATQPSKKKQSGKTVKLQGDLGAN
jgi:hypothetical protein